ncbi:MAG: tRNA1(Val) (adenine(37)-N6)-methyltransferase [Clostridia bacterium]
MSERIDELGIDNLKIIQNSDYFCFGTDSVLLANFVKSNSNSNVILELCSGSGVIPVIISAKKKYSKIFAVELQNEMFDLLKRNIEYNKLEEKIIPIHEDIKEIKSIKDKIREKIDIVVVNPPYKTVGTGILNDNDIKYIAKHEVKCTLEDIFSTSARLTKYKGKLYMVHKPERLVDVLCIARKYNFEAKQMQLVYPKSNLAPSIVLVEYVLGGGNELRISKPLIEYNNDGSYTKEFLKIYESNENVDTREEEIN